MNRIPEQVRQFIEVNIDSVDQLEILRILGEDPEKEWSATALVEAVQSSSQAIGQHLAALQSRGLLVAATRGPVFYCRFGAQTSELNDTMARLLQVYRERPVTMINLVHAKARRAI